MKTCKYCNKEISYHEIYCSDDCTTKSENFFNVENKFGKLFSILNIIFLFSIPIGIFLFAFTDKIGALIASTGALLLGITILLLPFPTEGMIVKYKLKKSITLVQIIGCILIVLAIAFFTLFLLI